MLSWSQRKPKTVMKFKRFSKMAFLQQIGRPLLGEFFNKFKSELATKGVELSGAGLDDEAYFKAVARIANSPGGVPDELFEAMFVIEEMANQEGQERLERAVAEAQLTLEFAENSTHADLAVQVWLAAPEVLTRKHNELRLVRLAAFEYFGCKAPEDRRGKVAMPGQDTIARVEADLDDWFNRHHRGPETAHIETYVINGEFWFLVRHGDTFARTAKVENGKLGVLHFRPVKDDVVVYSPERDEIRIHAGTKGEKELYRETFGMRVFGDDRYFSERKAYTLEPLRTDGADALDATDIEGIENIVLREIEVAWNGSFNRCIVVRADDLFAAAAEVNAASAVPASGRFVRAVFEVQFEGSPKARKVEVRPPNILKLGRHCDAVRVQRWLFERGFRATVVAGDGGGGTSQRTEGNITHVQPVARA